MSRVSGANLSILEPLLGRTTGVSLPFLQFCGLALPMTTHCCYPRCFLETRTPSAPTLLTLGTSSPSARRRFTAVQLLRGLLFSLAPLVSHLCLLWPSVKIRYPKLGRGIVVTLPTVEGAVCQTMR
ncbi:hypothetical protein GALMADRAFT_1142175 [Galerina marginata CBS 339.88]|uniref:Uncharacterized protein n=1 Tax=Galerina marginata (strain CBS 339.88) TaxID=685588 RepID=A0A067SG18_GALM3|nr:hypothetical protein GALMADRAFT_1142175 [Galerina marginata CBS 339.88]